MLKYLIEIKNRIFLLMLTSVSTLLFSYFFKETLLFLVAQPDRLLNNFTVFYFIFTNITEVFSVYVKLINFIFIQVFFFYAVFHLFIYLSPAMYKKEYCYLKLFLKIFFMVWFFSVVIANLLLVPLTWNFFFSFQNLISNKFVCMHFEAKLSEYLSFYITLYYMCVFYCQIFTILFFFLNFVNNKIKIIRKFRKFYYYFFVIFSTLISPPDIFSQIIISVFLIFFYEVLVFSFVVKNILTRKPVKAN